MNEVHTLASAWTWNPVVIGGCLFLLALYSLVLRFRFPKRSLLFLLGVALLFVALASPLNLLARTYLFTAHAIQELFLLQVAPAFLILGIPGSVAAGPIQRLPFPARVVKNPAVGWIAGIGAMIAWHVPTLFNMALRSSEVAAVQHGSFLVAGGLFWWPVLAPLKSERMTPVPWSALYLIGACIPCSLLSIALTFTHIGLYVPYYSPQDAIGILPLLRETWGLSLEVDQQTGGLFLWIGGCMVYLSAVMGMFLYWYNSAEVRDEFAPKVAQRP